MPSWKLFPDKTPKPDPNKTAPPIAKAKAELSETRAKRLKAEQAKLKAKQKALAKKKPTTLSSPSRYGLPGNPHDKLVQDLIDGLTDGTIILRSIDVRRTASKPYIDMVIEAIQTDTTTPTVPQKLHAGPVGLVGPVGPTGVTGATGPAPAHAIAPAPAAMSAVAMSASATTSLGGSGASMLSKVAALPGAKSYGLKQSQSEEPVVGYRDFKLTQGLFGYALQSRNGAVWPARRRMEALCNGNPFVGHDVPDPGCQCGIYAYEKPDTPALVNSGLATIWGEIAMWGDVLVCETGYRSEFAYPTALFVRNPAGANKKPTRTIERLKAELEDSYGVPVFILAERASKTASDLMQEILQRELGDIFREESSDA